MAAEGRVVNAGTVCQETVHYGQGMKGVVSVQLCLERQLQSKVFPTQVGRWNAESTSKIYFTGRFQAPRDDVQHTVQRNI